MDKILAYIRISTNKQEKGASLEFQRKLIQEYCTRNNLILNEEDVFTDIGSGTKLERPEFTKMREIIKNSNGIKHVIVYSIDRLTRSVYIGEIIARDIYKKNGSIVSVTQGFDDKEIAGRMTRQMLTVIAEQEVLTIKQRMSNGRKVFKEKGLFCGGKAPMGYATVGNSTQRGFGKLNVNSKEREAMDLMLALHKTGESYRAIAKLLTEKGFLTRKGTPFNPGSIKKIINKTEHANQN